MSDPTRMGRILDLVISPRDSDFVRECHVAGPIDEADHLTVLTSIKARESKLLIKMVCFRPWKSVDPRSSPSTCPGRRLLLTRLMTRHVGNVAQMVERSLCMREVRRSMLRVSRV